MKDQFIDFLNRKVDEYNQPSFIKNDPVAIPHQYSLKQDIEIAAFFAAIFSWGNRATIIQKCKDLLVRMDNAPYDYIKNHEQKHLKVLLGFKHRTFNDTDLIYFVTFLNHHYNKNLTLETAFTYWIHSESETIKNALDGFYHYFFSLADVPARTCKQIASPWKKSSCKRLNMFMRWMVRKDKQGVDFGIWQKISPAQLICPIDVHVARVARRFNLLSRKQVDWEAAMELTNHLRKFDERDPVKYDFALFGLGVMEKF